MSIQVNHLYNEPAPSLTSATGQLYKFDGKVRGACWWYVSLIELLALYPKEMTDTEKLQVNSLAVPIKQVKGTEKWTVDGKLSLGAYYKTITVQNPVRTPPLGFGGMRWMFGHQPEFCEWRDVN